MKYFPVWTPFFVDITVIDMCMSIKMWQHFLSIRECNFDKFVYTQNWILLKIQENWSTKMLMNHSILRIELESKIFYKWNRHVNLNISWLSSIKEAMVFNWVITCCFSVWCSWSGTGVSRTNLRMESQEVEKSWKRDCR